VKILQDMNGWIVTPTGYRFAGITVNGSFLVVEFEDETSTTIARQFVNDQGRVVATETNTFPRAVPVDSRAAATEVLSWAQQLWQWIIGLFSRRKK
jgi:hypothetical protein